MLKIKSDLILSNTLENVYWKQVKKFGKQTKEQLFRRLQEEIVEYFQACDDNETELCEEVLLEKADVIIMANRCVLETGNPFAAIILKLLYTEDMDYWIIKKWKIVESREYYIDENGDWRKKKLTIN